VSLPVQFRSIVARLSNLVRADWTFFNHDHGSTAKGGTIGIGGIPAHASTHKDGGSDEVAVVTATRGAIPKANTSGVLDTSWLNYGSSAGTVCQGNDSRLSDARTPTSHATSHKHGGSDEVSTATAAANAIPKAGSNSKLDPTWLPTSAPHDRRHFGTSNYESWYIAGCTAGVGLTTVAVLANRIYARSFTAPFDSGVTVDRLGIEVTTAAGTLCRLGLYTYNNGYPDQLLIDAGTVSTAGIAAVAATISQALIPGQRYFAVAVFDGTPTLRAITVNQADPDLGFPATIGATMQVGFHSALTFGALPGTFPATPTMLTGVPFPALTRRYSA
jgi:hypothetical protein